MNERSISVITANLPILLLLTLLFMLVVYYYNKKWKDVVKEKLLMEKTFAEELSATQSTIREETFRSISQEIHDNIGQSLSLVKLNMVTTNPENSAQVAEKLEESKKLLSKTMQDLRNLAHSLNPDFLTFIGLPEAVKQQLNQLNRGTYKTEFSVTGCWPQRNGQKEFTILRVVQELLHNIIKHASATAISIHMQYLDDELILIVKDNGNGFCNTGKDSGNGMGLMNVCNRLQKINGTIKHESHTGTGTTVFVVVRKE